MTQSEIAQLAASVGFPDPALAAAIAMAESSGNPRAHNSTPPDDSYGLWQINMYGPLAAQRRAQFGLSSNADLYDPATNARVAVAIFGAQGYSAWGAYTNGTYRRFYTGGAPAASGDPGAGGLSMPNLPGLDTMVETPLGTFSLPVVIAAFVVAYLILK